MNTKPIAFQLIRLLAVSAAASACLVALSTDWAWAEMGNTPVSIRIVQEEDGQNVSHASARIYDYQTGRWFIGNPNVLGGVWNVNLSPGHYQVNASQHPDRPSAFKDFVVFDHPIGVLVELRRQPGSGPPSGPAVVTIKIVREEDGQPVSHARARIYHFQSGQWIKSNNNVVGGIWEVQLPQGHYQVNATQEPDRPSVFKDFVVFQHPIGVLVELRRR